MSEELKRCPICTCEMEYKEGDRIYVPILDKYYGCCYCGQCDLSVPYIFEDCRAKGDKG